MSEIQRERERKRELTSWTNKINIERKYRLINTLRQVGTEMDRKIQVEKCKDILIDGDGQRDIDVTDVRELVVNISKNFRESNIKQYFMFFLSNKCEGDN